MAYYEHLGGLKYRLCTNDPSAIGRKRIYLPVVLPEEVVKSERKTKQFLDLELAKFVEQVNTGQFIKTDKLTLKEFIPQWKKGYADQNMGKYTRYTTDNILNIYILPIFGEMRMDKVKTLHIINFMAELVRKDGKPMATNTKKNIYKVINSVFNYAKQWQVIAINPMDGVDSPTAGKQEKRKMRQRKSHYTKAEAQAVISALYDLPNRWRLYYLGVLLGGFRRGEMLAVEWHLHVNFDAGGLYIEKQITLDENGQKNEDEVKTEASEGFIPMPQWYMEELKKFRVEWKNEKQLVKEWRGGLKQYVFHSGQGTMYYPNTPSLTWRRFLAARELPHIRLHDLRHTTAMLLREYGADVKQIQERLRHSKTATTTDTYMHESELISRDSADKLEILNPKNAPSSAPN
ncbi:tyrosine-type recombinase/integrase [Paenibacillus sp. strain BS8-2]